MFPCPLCDENNFRSFKKLLSHIRFIHSHEPNFSISCANCGQSFKKFSSFKSHIRREELKRQVGAFGANEEEEVENLIDEDDSGDEIENDEAETADARVESMTRFLALFILKIKETNQLNHQTMNCILETSDDLITASLDTLRTKIRKCLSENNIELGDVQGLSDILEEPSDFAAAKEALNSEYLQMRYFVDNFNYVEPEEIILKQSIAYKTVNGRQKMFLVKETFHYVPVLKTLEALLNDPDVLAEVHNDHSSTDGLFRDFCDGDDFKNHQLFANSPDALVLHCYYDDFQVTNPLGSKTKKHKIGAFYFVLGNLKPCYRSVINVMQLIALCRVPLISQYGMDRILQPFMRDIAILESEAGVRMTIEQHYRTFRGTIGPFSADNLGSHALGGYIESFSSLRVCRFCMATNNDIQTKFSESQFQMRTRETYDRHACMVRDDPSLKTTYGLNRSSILNQSEFFHVVNGLVPDVMHDQLEGVLPLQVKLLLKKFINSDKLITLDEINERIQGFNYGTVDCSNKPSPIKQQALAADNVSASLSQSAAQMWCLARLLPILIGDVIPEDGEDCWTNFLTLLRIEEIVFAPTTSVHLAAYLAVLVEEYLSEFQRLHDRRAIPKQHYMVHYPKHMLRSGPLVRNWSMRFEAKHNYFKRLADKINNFKNITYSLAKRHQVLQSYLLQGSAGTALRIHLEVGPGKKSTVQEEELEDPLQELDEAISGDSILVRASWVKVFGTRYKKGSVVVISLRHGDPVFGKIYQVLLVDGTTVIFEYILIQTIGFVEHLNAYKVRSANLISFVRQGDLYDFHPLDILTGYGRYVNQHFVVLRYRLDYNS